LEKGPVLISETGGLYSMTWKEAMKRLPLIHGCAVAGLVVFSAFAHAQQSSVSEETPPLRLIQEIPLSGVQGRIDHFTVDGERERLIFSALANSTVEIVSLFAGKVVHTITGLDQPQGVLYVPENDRIIVANAGDGKVRVYDGTSFQLVKTIDFGKDPDNIRYDAAAKRIYVGYGEDEGGTIGIIDAVTDERVSGDYKLGGGHPESFQLEGSGPKMFVNDPDGGNIVLGIDRLTRSVSKWELHGNRFNFPMALDEANHRLFVGTRRPSKLNVLNTETGELVAALTCAGDTDDMYYDPRGKRIYIIGGAGFISVIEQRDADHYQLKASIPSSIGARTGYYYPTHDTDRLYVAVPAHAGQGAELWVYEVQD
jgi:DNA-binding beta-propeller fold protein YncE